MNTMPGTFTVPNTCPHGVVWAVPCAACNRPIPASAFDAAAMRDLAAAIRDLAAAIRADRTEEPRG